MNDLFRHKDLIYTIYEEQSFSKAAQRLYITQPSLSNSVKKLEDEIGIPLFDRTCKPVRMTEIGRAYIETATKIREAEKSFNNYLCMINDMEAGSINIGSNQLLSSLVLPHYISCFIRCYPKIQLDLLDANSAVLENKIMAGELDFIIDNQELDATLFERKFLKAEYLLLAVPDSFSINQQLQKYRLAYQDILSNKHVNPDHPAVPLEKFADIPFILMTKENDTRSRSNSIFRYSGFHPNVLLELDRLITLYNFIEIGTAASIVSDTLIQHIHGKRRPENVAISFYKLSTQYAKRDIYISWKRGKFHSKAMAAFIDSLQDLTQVLES